MENKEIRFADDGSGYGTHLNALKLLFKAFEIQTVMEFGMGMFSTLFFLHNGCTVTSVEMQSLDWFSKMVGEIKSDKWKPFLDLKYDCYNKFPGRVDLAFIDGHLNSRPECVNWMFERANIIVAHDYECSIYGWGRICKPENFHQVNYVTNGLITTVFINNSLYE